MAEPTIACVIPSHLRAARLEVALESVLGQRRAPDEVLVVDDAGDDATRAVVDRFARRSSIAVRYVRNDSRPGASASRNVGASASTATALAFLDDDDRWEADYLERAAAALGGVDFVVTWLAVDLGDGMRAGPSMRAGLLADEVLALNPGMTGSNLLITRAAFEAVGGFDEDLWVSNDKDLLIRLLDDGRRYAVVSEPLAVKQAHPDARLASPGPRRLEAMDRYLSKYGDRLSRRDRRLLLAKRARVVFKAETRVVPRVASALRYAWLTRGRGRRQLTGDAESQDGSS